MAAAEPPLLRRDPRGARALSTAWPRTWTSSPTEVAGRRPLAPAGPGWSPDTSRAPASGTDRARRSKAPFIVLHGDGASRRSQILAAAVEAGPRTSPTMRSLRYAAAVGSVRG